MVDLPTIALREIGALSRGKGITKAEISTTGVPCIRYGEIYTSYGNVTFELNSNASIEAAEKSTPIEAGDIIIAASGETTEEIGKAVAYLGNEAAVAGGDTLVLKGHGQDPTYLAHALNSETVVRQKSRLGKGNSVVHIHASDLESVKVPLPPLLEQRKIAEILRTWDGALEALTALRTAKTRRLDSLRAALLFGGLRLDGQRRNWELRRLAEFTHELTARNGQNALGRDAVMGVTKANGIVPMREQTIATNISRYKRLPPRAFAYNPMRINVGSIAMNEGQSEVLVSPDYVVFGCDADGLDPNYLDHLRKTRWWGHYINSGGSGSVRMRTYYDDLAAMKLLLPELDEQREITRILNTARDDLIITEKEIKAFNHQKRGLMQKLLTGEWRVQP